MATISQTSNKDLMTRARASLKGKWGLGVGIHAFWFLLSAIIGGITGGGSALIQILIVGSISLGIAEVFLTIARKGDSGFARIFDGFKRFGTALGTYLLMVVFILLWSLLLIVPGIIAALSYSLAWYVLIDDPAAGPTEALSTSKAMMRGNKWKMFCLYFRFTGWFLLCIPTVGIGLLWLCPYMQTSLAHFYEDIKHGAAVEF